MKGFVTACIVVIALLAFIFITRMQQNTLSDKNDPEKTLSQLNPNSQPNSASSAAQIFSSVAGANTQNKTQQAVPPKPQPTLIEVQLVASMSATIKTQKGDITIQLYPQDAPKTVKNFATLAVNGYYNNLTFHRVEPGFVIQGGDPNGDGTGGISIYGPTFEDELNPSTQSYQDGYKEGVVAMANRGPNTNGSQFFIMLADNVGLPKNYTIFGKVTSGMEVVKEIQKGDKMLSVTIQ